MDLTLQKAQREIEQELVTLMRLDGFPHPPVVGDTMLVSMSKIVAYIKYLRARQAVRQ